MIFSIITFDLFMLIFFGEMNLERLKFNGPYKVGYREYKTKQFGNEVSIYYPIDEVEYNNKKDSSECFPHWITHGWDQLDGMSTSIKNYRTVKRKPPKFLLRPYLSIILDVIKNGIPIKSF